MLNLTSATARQAYLLESIRTSMRFERGMRKRSVPLIDRQARDASKRYEETEDLEATLATVGAYDEKWGKLFFWQHGRVGDYIGEKFFNALKGNQIHIETKDFDQFRALFRNHILALGAAKVVQVQDTTRKFIKTAVQDAIDAGLSGYYIADEIYNRVSGIGRLTATVRARTIARTETHQGYNSATHMAGLSAGISLDKAWISAESERTRPEHAAADGQTVDIKEPFIVGGEELMYPGDPRGSAGNVINCRCTVEHITR